MLRIFLPGLLVNFVLVTSLQAVTYEVTFTGTWNASHISVPYPASGHFTELVGATHEVSAQFWEEGSLASSGVENVAELGLASTLRSELEAARLAGTTGEYIETGSLFSLPNSDTIQIEVKADKPYITLISMIAPSPDWFVGVSGLSLRKNGIWRSIVNVDLVPWDAGTEEGDGFSLGNPETSPHEPIARISGSPFVGTPTIATLKFKLKTPSPPPVVPGIFDAQAAISTLLLE